LYFFDENLGLVLKDSYNDSMSSISGVSFNKVFYEYAISIDFTPDSRHLRLFEINYLTYEIKLIDQINISSNFGQFLGIDWD
jgi:hypothetical protein